jgi:hypothetical protein
VAHAACSWPSIRLSVVCSLRPHYRIPSPALPSQAQSCAPVLCVNTYIFTPLHTSLLLTHPCSPDTAQPATRACRAVPCRRSSPWLRRSTRHRRFGSTPRPDSSGTRSVEGARDHPLAFPNSFSTASTLRTHSMCTLNRPTMDVQRLLMRALLRVMDSRDVCGCA